MFIMMTFFGEYTQHVVTSLHLEFDKSFNLVYIILFKNWSVLPYFHYRSKVDEQIESMQQTTGIVSAGPHVSIPCIINSDISYLILIRLFPF